MNECKYDRGEVLKNRNEYITQGIRIISNISEILFKIIKPQPWEQEVTPPPQSHDYHNHELIQMTRDHAHDKEECQKMAGNNNNNANYPQQYYQSPQINNPHYQSFYHNKVKVFCDRDKERSRQIYGQNLNTFWTNLANGKKYQHTQIPVSIHDFDSKDCLLNFNDITNYTLLDHIYKHYTYRNGHYLSSRGQTNYLVAFIEQVFIPTLNNCPLKTQVIMSGELQDEGHHKWLELIKFMMNFCKFALPIEENINKQRFHKYDDWYKVENQSGVKVFNNVSRFVKQDQQDHGNIYHIRNVQNIEDAITKYNEVFGQQTMEQIIEQKSCIHPSKQAVGFQLRSMSEYFIKGKNYYDIHQFKEAMQTAHETMIRLFEKYLITFFYPIIFPSPDAVPYIITTSASGGKGNFNYDRPLQRLYNKAKIYINFELNQHQFHLFFRKGIYALRTLLDAEKGAKEFEYLRYIRFSVHPMTKNWIKWIKTGREAQYNQDKQGWREKEKIFFIHPHDKKVFWKRC